MVRKFVGLQNSFNIRMREKYLGWLKLVGQHHNDGVFSVILTLTYQLHHIYICLQCAPDLSGFYALEAR